VKALVVEDEPALAQALQSILKEIGLTVDSVDRVDDAISLASNGDYAIVVLDRLLPDGDGLTVLRAIKRGDRRAPVLMLTALDSIEARIAGLEQGADDHLGKPFDRRELAARVRALLRRPDLAPGRPLIIGGLSFDARERAFSGPHGPIVLGGRELQLLEALVLRSERVVTRARLESAVYGLDDEVGGNAMEALVSRVRQRLRDGEVGAEIVTIRGVGYMLTDGS